MRITCQRENLVHGLSTVSRATTGRATMPILANVLLDAQTSASLRAEGPVEPNGGLKLSATDLELGITVQVTGVTVDEPGAITVPARLLTDLVKSLPGEEVILECNNSTLNLTCDRFDTHVKGMEAEEFPILEVEGQEIAQVYADELRDAIQRVAIAAAKEETRPILTGVLLHFQGERLTMAAADGFRLAKDDVPLPEPVSEPIEVVIPALALTELSRLLAHQTKPVEMVVSEGGTRVMFRLTGAQPVGPRWGLVTQVIEGKFPDYRQIIPQSHPGPRGAAGAGTTRLVCDRSELLKAVRLGNLFAREESKGIRLNVAAKEEGHITLEATSAELGDNVSEVEAAITGEPIEIVFNASYLVDVLAALDTPQVAMEMTTGNAPFVVRTAGSAMTTGITTGATWTDNWRCAVSMLSLVAGASWPNWQKTSEARLVRRLTCLS